MLTAYVLRNIKTGEYVKQGGNPFKTQQIPSAWADAKQLYLHDPVNYPEFEQDQPAFLSANGFKSETVTLRNGHTYERWSDEASKFYWAAYSAWSNSITNEQLRPYKRYETVRITLPIVQNGVTIAPYSEEVIE